jgi:hypothetical protein
MLAQEDASQQLRVVKRQLYFIPYYRLSGHDFSWQMASPKPEPEKKRTLQPVKTPPSKPKTKELEGPFLAINEETEFRDRYVEKNFLACDLEGFGMYSLGIRPAVLRLELFQRAILEASGRVVSVQTSPEVALSRGMKTASSQNTLYRQIIGRVLSLIYFPFWVVELKSHVENRLTIVDAVSETVTKLDATPSLYTVLDREQRSDPQPQVIGFRPLVCPNCGWDLPFKPDEILFFCSSCSRAWQIQATQLSEVPYEIAERPSTGKEEPLKYLPFWVIQAEIDNRPFRFFLPAFRYRRLKFLSDLAMNFSRRQPHYSLLKDEMPDVHGCYYDQEDAVMLAQFIYAGFSSKQVVGMTALRENKFSLGHATLTWFPFKPEGNFLLDLFTGLSLPRNLLL